MWLVFTYPLQILHVCHCQHVHMKITEWNATELSRELGSEPGL